MPHSSASIPKTLNEIKWVSTKKSSLGQSRNKWWEKKITEFDVLQKSDVARILHPKELEGLKPCQICGKELSIFYVYPNKVTLKQINNLMNESFISYEKTIDEIIDILFKKNNTENIKKFSKIFKLNNINSSTKINDFKIIVRENGKSKLSPGVMSNAPDRLEGFHTYNACCRTKEDSGRSALNMKTYNQDRRAYEYWTDGDFNLSNRLMGEINKIEQHHKCPKCKKLKKMTADHIGPISLGFANIPCFDPLCNSCNSAKNNRMTYTNVRDLIKLELKFKVISWHSEIVWNKLKKKVKNDKDAVELSNLMKKNLQSVLTFFALVSIFDNGKEFLQRNYLNPQYAFFDYRFKNLNIFNFDNLKILKKPLVSANKKSNARRYIRISFESLKGFLTKQNRKSNSLEFILKSLDNNKFKRFKDSLENNHSKELKIQLFEELVMNIQEAILENSTF